MDLLTSEQYEKLVENYYRFNQSKQIPIVYLMAPQKDWYWLISEINPDNDKAYGLTDLNNNQLELGEIDILAISELRENGMTIYNHPTFSTEYSLAVFNEIGAIIGQLVVAEDLLDDEFKDCQNRLYNMP